MDTEQEKTPLQQKLDEFSQQLSKVSTGRLLLFVAPVLLTLPVAITLVVTVLHTSHHGTATNAIGALDIPTAFRVVIAFHVRIAFRSSFHKSSPTCHVGLSRFHWLAASAGKVAANPCCGWVTTDAWGWPSEALELRVGGGQVSRSRCLNAASCRSYGGPGWRWRLLGMRDEDRWGWSHAWGCRRNSGVLAGGRGSSCCALCSFSGVDHVGGFLFGRDVLCVRCLCSSLCLPLFAGAAAVAVVAMGGIVLCPDPYICCPRQDLFLFTQIQRIHLSWFWWMGDRSWHCLSI